MFISAELTTNSAQFVTERAVDSFAPFANEPRGLTRNTVLGKKEHLGDRAYRAYRAHPRPLARGLGARCLELLSLRISLDALQVEHFLSRFSGKLVVKNIVHIKNKLYGGALEPQTA